MKTEQGLSAFFSCNIGLRQGENLPPILFSLFLNDLKSIFSRSVNGLKLPHSIARDFDFHDIENYVHLFLLLYADDTIILAETPGDMQKALDVLKEYCEKFGLCINTSKTKIVILPLALKLALICPKFFFFFVFIIIVDVIFIMCSQS